MIDMLNAEALGLLIFAALAGVVLAAAVIGTIDAITPLNTGDDNG